MYFSRQMNESKAQPTTIDTRSNIEQQERKSAFNVKFIQRFARRAQNYSELTSGEKKVTSEN